MSEMDKLVRSSRLTGFYTTVVLDEENLTGTLEQLQSLRSRCNYIHKECDPNCKVAKAIANIEKGLQKKI